MHLRAKNVLKCLFVFVILQNPDALGGGGYSLWIFAASIL